MAVERKYERDMDLLLAEEFWASRPFATWFLNQTRDFKGVDATVIDVAVSQTDSTGESDLVVVYETSEDKSRFALHIEDKINAPLQPEQEARYRLRGARGVLRGDYKAFEVLLCSPETYLLGREGAAAFDAFVTYEAISAFFKSQTQDLRCLYRANFVATAAKKTSNTWLPMDDAMTNAFWKAAYEIATREFPDLEMKPPKFTKDQTWISFRPLGMPTQPRQIYVALKGGFGFVDLTFTSCLARLFLPQVKPILHHTMTVHQTGKAAAIRIVVEPFAICEVDEITLAKVRAAFSASVNLIQFYRQNRQALNNAVVSQTEREVVVYLREGIRSVRFVRRRCRISAR